MQRAERATAAQFVAVLIQKLASPQSGTLSRTRLHRDPPCSPPPPRGPSSEGPSRRIRPIPVFPAPAANGSHVANASSSADVRSPNPSGTEAGGAGDCSSGDASAAAAGHGSRRRSQTVLLVSGSVLCSAGARISSNEPPERQITVYSIRTLPSRSRSRRWLVVSAGPRTQSLNLRLSLRRPGLCKAINRCTSALSFPT